MRAVQRIAALLIGLVAAVTVCELVLANLPFVIDTPPGLFRPSATRAFEHRPGFRGRDMRRNPIRLNSKGLRDVEYAVPKPAGVTRILVLGDSVAFGDGVKAEETFSDQLERLLNAGGRTGAYEVLNAGIRGYNTYQQSILLREIGLDYEPDVVLVAYVLNDAEPLHRQSGLIDRRHSHLIALKDFIKAHSFLYAFLRRNMELMRHRVTPERFVETYDDQFAPDDPGWQASRQALRDIASTCRAEGIRPLLAVFPRLEGTGPGQTYPHRHLHEQVLTAAREAGFETMDLLEAYQGEDPESLRVGPGDIFHPDPRGHELAARALSAFFGKDPAGGSGP